MPKIGVDVLIEAGGEVIGGQRNATLNREVNSVDATHKQTAGWAYSIAGQGSWSIDCDGVLLEGDGGLATLEEAFENKEEVDITFTNPTGTSYTGSAILTTFPIEAPMDDVMTYSLSFQGQGKYQKTNGGGASSQSAGVQTFNAVSKSSTKDDIKKELDRIGVAHTEEETKDQLLKKLGEAQ